MKFFSFLITLLICVSFHSSYAEDALTVKQQLDRISEEISDLNKAVFNKTFDPNNLYLSKEPNEIERFTSIDIRIYDLEKDIKNLTFQFEEILFKLEDISNNMSTLEIKLIGKIKKINNSKKIDIETDEQDLIESKLEKEKNTLGKLIISENKKNLNKADSKNLLEEKEKNKNIQDEETRETKNILPEEELQFALDQMRKKNFDKSKKILENFVIKFPEHQLSGSAYFWLGKIYLFQLNYRDAALVFGEGVQKFPNSIKAAEMYYELVKSLKEMDKIIEACKTFSLFKEKYKNNKFTRDPDKIMDKQSCENLN